MSEKTERSKVDVALAYRTLWATNGLNIAPVRLEGGFEVLQPDSWSVKLSLLAAPEDCEARLKQVLDTIARRDRAYSLISPRLLQYARERKNAKGGGEEHKYVLLTEGRHGDPKHRLVMSLLAQFGLGEIGSTINLVAAPLLRATHRSGTVLTPMPFMATSTYDNLKKTFAGAFELSNPPGDPDPEFDVQGHEKPRLGNHSWRRYADKRAKQEMEFLLSKGLSKMTIDLYFGWNLHEYDKEMQERYAGQLRSERVRRRFLTLRC